MTRLRAKLRAAVERAARWVRVNALRLVALGSLLCLGAGLAWWVHPGAGLVALGGLAWIDLTLASIHR